MKIKTEISRALGLLKYAKQYNPNSTVTDVFILYLIRLNVICFILISFFILKGIDQVIEDSCPQIISAIRNIIHCETISADIKDQVSALIYRF